MRNRRTFLQQSTAAGAALMMPGWLNAFGNIQEELTRLIILHTNDVHSRLEPFPDDGSRNAGLGGAAVRAAMIEKIRKENEHVLLFDAGDIFQGTPYFNFYLGEPDIKLMSAMKYDGTTMGNHDFDGSLENFERQMRDHATFPLIIANYDFSDTVMHDRFMTRKVFQKGDIKIGVTGVGIELDGLVPTSLYGNTKYLDPIAKATAEAAILRHDEKCDIVICLSHLGYKFSGDKVCDITLAQNSRDIDIIIGGHTHTFMDQPDMQRNKDGAPVIIHQVGWGGIRLGKMEITLERNKRNKCVTCEGMWVKEKNA